MARYLVVGAGISGATVANVLSQDASAEVTVVDRNPFVGGLCRDHRDPSGITVHDFGSHILHTDDEEVWEFLNRFTGFNGYRHRVLACIGELEVPLPFDFRGVRACFGHEESERIISKLLALYPEGTRVPLGEILRVDDPDIARLSRFVHDNVFLGYTLKQWGVTPEQVDPSVTARVPVVIGEADGYFTSRFQGIPLKGYTGMISAMLDRPNIRVLLDTDFRDVPDVNTYERIFYTGPVDELLGYSEGRLPYRSERFVFETLPEEHHQSAAVVNHPNDGGFTRVHEFKHYLGEESPVTVVCREYPCAYEPGVNLPCYPVPGRANGELHARCAELVRGRYPNMVILGRLGSYRYLDMDRAVREALDVVRELR